MVERGKNTLGVETEGVLSAEPDVDNTQMCPNVPKESWCQNGGSFLSDCTCDCPPKFGFGGPTCSTLVMNCTFGTGVVVPGNAMTGTQTKVVCPCSPGYLTPSNMPGADDCSFAAAIWAGNSTLTPTMRETLNSTVIGIVDSTGSASFQWIFAKDANLTNGYEPLIHCGDFVVAVPIGTFPWTAATNWAGNAALAYVCGPPAVIDKKLIGCAYAYPYGKDRDGDGTAMGTLSINAPGFYDVYYIKYNGVNEFGMDKGYGKNWVKFPYVLEVWSSRRASLTVSQSQAAATNLANQQKLMLSANTKKATVIAAAATATEAAATAAAVADFENNLYRTIFWNLTISGLTDSQFTVKEQTILKAVYADVVGTVCQPPQIGNFTKKGNTTAPANGSNSSKISQTAQLVANCTFRDAWIGDGTPGIVKAPVFVPPKTLFVYGYVVVSDSAAVNVASKSISTHYTNGQLYTAIKNGGGNFKSLNFSISLGVAKQAASSGSTPTLTVTTISQKIGFSTIFTVTNTSDPNRKAAFCSYATACGIGTCVSGIFVPATGLTLKMSASTRRGTSVVFTTTITTCSSNCVGISAATASMASSISTNTASPSLGTNIQAAYATAAASIPGATATISLPIVEAPVIIKMTTGPNSGEASGRLITPYTILGLSLVLGVVC